MKNLTSQQFNDLLKEPLRLNFEMEQCQKDVYWCSCRDYLLVEGEVFNVEADIYLEYKERTGKEHYELFITRIIDEDCNEYEFTTEQELIFQKHFKNSFSVEVLAAQAMPREYIWDYSY